MGDSLGLFGAWYMGNMMNENFSNVDDGYSYACLDFCEPLFDQINNVEVVFIPGSFASTRRFSITVSHNGGPSAQSFALYAYNLKVAERANQ